jgi:uncharacterized alkaline shock family protein YloU
MSETQSARSEAAGAPSDSSSAAMTRRGGELPDSSGRGSTTISDAVVTKIASIAAREVRGVYDLGGGASRAIGGLTRRVGVGDERMQGVGVEVGEREAAVDLTVVVEYGESIPQIAKSLRENITRRIEGMTGLRVTEVNVAINDLYFPGDEVVPEPGRVE